MTVAAIAAALGNSLRAGSWWRCVYPLDGSQTGRSVTLAVHDHERGLVVPCHAGCRRESILAELFRRALLCGSANPSPQAVKRNNGDDQDARGVEIARRVWARANGARGGPEVRYLRSRGVTIPPPLALHWTVACKAGPTGRYLPAPIRRVVNHDDELVASHRINSLPDGTGNAAVYRQYQKNIAQIRGRGGSARPTRSRPRADRRRAP
jgi:hypothetical protein